MIVSLTFNMLVVAIGVVVVVVFVAHSAHRRTFVCFLSVFACQGKNWQL